MKCLFISDLHLCSERPETLRAFFAFLKGPARNASALYILGDLFEYWAGDDDETELATLVAQALKALSDQGISVSFVAGNRDFLIGESWARRAGMTRLPDPILIEADGLRILLSHGDTLCTDDIAYQEYRRKVRDPAWQQAFLSRPLDERRRFIEALRDHSRSEKAVKSAGIMDVNPAAVEHLLREYGHPVLIHGHTHRPARHVHLVDGRYCERWVLADWHSEAHWLAWDGTAIEAHRLHPAGC